MSNEKNLISVVIPTYNRKEEIKECLENIYKQEYPRDKYEVIVVDDGSHDNTSDVLEQCRIQLSNFRYFIRSNEGPGKARNYGAKKAEGNILVFIDSDCIMTPGFLEIIEDIFDKYENIAACSGDAISIFKDKLFYPLSDYYQKKKRRHYEAHLINELTPFFKLRTDCCALKKDIFKKLGGFNKDFSQSAAEDIELGYRMLQNGYNTLFCGKLLVKHYQRANLIDMLKRSYRFGCHDVIHHKKYFDDSFTLEFSDFPFIKPIYVTKSPVGFYMNFNFSKALLLFMVVGFISLKLAASLIIIYLFAIYFQTKGFNVFWRFLLYKILNNTAYLMGNLKGSFKNKTVYI
jgi:glycosyltransferase involved in cell wall biosynthesis